MILDSTYFNGELSLPLADIKYEAVGHSSKAMQSVSEKNLNWFVDKYEREFLKRLLGNTLYENFIEGLTDGTNDIWNDLKNALYITGDYSYSPAANYVYYWYRRDARTQTAIHGEKAGTQDYTEIAEDRNKLVKAWNDMCCMIEEFRCFLKKNWNVYKGYSDNHMCCYKFNRINIYNL